MNDMISLCRNRFLLWFIPCIFFWSCDRPAREGSVSDGESDSHVVVKRRGDGSVSSINQVDDLNRVNGIRVTYYADGKTIYSKTTFEHGIKNGLFERYYRNGQVFEHTPYKDGKADGLTKKYYMNGSLMAEFRSVNGLVLPGLKEYHRDGSPVTSYPEIRFREVDHLKDRNRVDLLIFCEPSGIPVKYFRREPGGDRSQRVYLISERGKASMEFYVKPGDTLKEELEISAEIPTELGNTLVRDLTYSLRVHHTL